jgi:hypothetical protein
MEMWTGIVTPSDLPAKGRWAPGSYWCECAICKRQFQGDKRAVQCARCAYNEPPSVEGRQPTPAEKEEQD